MSVLTINDYGLCRKCNRVIRLTRKGKCYRHGSIYKTSKEWRSVLVLRDHCSGSGISPKEPTSTYEWTDRSKAIREELGTLGHISEEYMDEVIDKGFTMVEVMEVMVELGYGLGRTENGLNEWWLK